MPSLCLRGHPYGISCWIESNRDTRDFLQSLDIDDRHIIRLFISNISRLVVGRDPAASGEHVGERHILAGTPEGTRLDELAGVDQVRLEASTPNSRLRSVSMRASGNDRTAGVTDRI